MKILGISAFYHDSAAVLVRDGEIVAAAQEERFTRKKHDPCFPSRSVAYCLKEAGARLEDLDAVVFYDKPLLKFERLLETYLSYAPRGIFSFLHAMPIWLKEKLFLKSLIRRELRAISGSSKLPPLLFSEHHQSHAASAFFPSPFDRAAVLCLDGVGEWATTSAWRGNGNELGLEWELHFPHSLGMLYSAFTYFTGFRVNSGEYKLMGLAPYGEPKYVSKILEHLIDLKDDGTFRLNMEYFAFATGLTMTNARFSELFGGPRREPEGPLTQREMDLARSVQVVTEEVILRLARTLQRETGEENLCLAGGVALNCVANGRLLREGPFKRIWIQPAAGDAGGALGAALAAYHQFFGRARIACADSVTDRMKGAYLGPDLPDGEIELMLKAHGARYERLSDTEIFQKTSHALAMGQVVGWVQGRMEFGPRALGARSILGDARNTKMQSTMNLKIKYRESFRPFAPAVLEEDLEKYFDLTCASPYMLLTAPVRESLRRIPTNGESALQGIDKLHVIRSDIPAVTHLDYSARVQTVSSETNPRFHALLTEFKRETGCSLLVNTSFNVRGEPIVANASDAYRCFMRTEMDALVVGNYWMSKSEQAPWRETGAWKEALALD